MLHPTPPAPQAKPYAESAAAPPSLPPLLKAKPAERPLSAAPKRLLLP